jgi:hypothetical protein
VISILLLLAFAGLASGFDNFLHDHLPTHDETHCSIEAALQAPTSAASVVPILITLGLLVAFLNELARPLISRRLLLRLDCRGPPLRSLSI